MNKKKIHITRGLGFDTRQNTFCKLNAIEKKPIDFLIMSWLQWAAAHFSIQMRQDANKVNVGIFDVKWERETQRSEIKNTIFFIRQN